jgi:hypothetical protein
MMRAVQEQFPVDRQRGSYAQTFARSVVDLIGIRITLLLAVCLFTPPPAERPTARQPQA